MIFGGFPKKQFSKQLWERVPQFIPHSVVVNSFCTSQFPDKSVNSFFVSVIVKDKLKFVGQLTSANRLERRFVWHNCVLSGQAPVDGKLARDAVENAWLYSLWFGVYG